MTSSSRPDGRARIGVNVSFLTQPLTGSGQYTTGLLAGLAEVDQENSYLMFDQTPNPFTIRNIQVPKTPGSQYLAPLEPRFATRENLRKVWFEQVGLPRDAAAQHCDLLHYPYFAAPLRSRVPVVTTIHDVIPLVLPAYRGSARVRAYMYLVSRAVRRARLVLTDSEAAKRDIVATLGLPAERVRVIHLAVSPGHRPLDDGTLAAVRKKYQLPDQFVFYLGGLDARKNVERLILAWEKLTDIPHLLVIAGDAYREGPLYPPLRRLVRERRLQRRVAFVGPVPDDGATLMAAATAFVFPSTYEGFGIPPLEAMACGTPVACSNASSLPEVVGDAALTFDPLSVDAIAASLRQLLTDEDLRHNLRARGRERAAQFSWEKTARETLSAYRDAMSNRW
jgi:glycosyltransferase involved in cell wall biosynthesis